MQEPLDAAMAAHTARDDCIYAIRTANITFRRGVKLGNYNFWQGNPSYPIAGTTTHENDIVRVIFVLINAASGA